MPGLCPLSTPILARDPRPAPRPRSRESRVAVETDGQPPSRTVTVSAGRCADSACRSPNIRGSLRSGVWAAAGTDRPVRGIPGLAWDRSFDRAPGRAAFRWILRPAFGEVVRFSPASFSEPAVDQGREACAGSASGNGTRDRRRGCFRGRPPEAAAGPAAGPPRPGGGVPGSSGCRALARGLLACPAARLPRMAAGAARRSALRPGPGRSARLCGGARPRSPGRAGIEGAMRFYQREGAVDFERRRSRPSPSISASRTRDPAAARRSGRPQFRASMRRPASSRCSPTGDDSTTPPRGERAGRRHSAGASSLLPPDPPPLIPERTGMLSSLDPPATVRCARRPAVHRDRDRDRHDRQEARAECPLWPAAHPAIGALHANGVKVRPVSLRRRSYLRLP